MVDGNTDESDATDEEGFETLHLVKKTRNYEITISMDSIFHILKSDLWNDAKTRGEYAPTSLREEGFIHCSMETQVAGVADRFFKGEENLVLLRIDPRKVKNEIRYEKASDGADGLFPHIYGVLNIDAVTEVVNFHRGGDGTFSLPNNSSK
jgi:uncharacterized protein (DUF952 family)